MHNSQARIFGYDLIKAIAIYMIVFYHLGGIDYGTFEPGHFFLPNLYIFFSAVCAAGVPLFFMVNGALVIPKNLHWKQLLFKSFHLLFLFVLWKLVLQYLISFKLLAIEDKMVHFWFLETLSIVYLMSIVLQKSSKVIHTGFFTLYSILYYQLGGALRTRQTSSFFAIGLIVLGLLLVNFEVVAMNNHYQAIYDGVNSSFPTIGALAMSIGIFFLLKDFSFNDGIPHLIISYVGRNTMGIFIFHVMGIILLRKYFPDALFNINPIIALLISLLIVLITASFSELLKKLHLRFLVSLSC